MSRLHIPIGNYIHNYTNLFLFTKDHKPNKRADSKKKSQDPPFPFVALEPLGKGHTQSCHEYHPCPEPEI